MSYKSFSFGLLGIALGAFMTGTLQYVIAWTAPTATAPDGNVSAPVNVSVNPQVKSGNLGVANFMANSVTVGSTVNLSAITSPKFCIGTDCITAWPTGGTGGGSTVGYGGMFVTGGGVNNVHLPVPCKRPNIITGACTCPTGYTANLAGYGGYYWWHQWDDYTWSYVCESTTGGGGGTGDNLGNHTATQNIDMNGSQVTDLGAPTNATDAATKAYVDAQIGGKTPAEILGRSGWPSHIACGDDPHRVLFTIRTSSPTLVMYYNTQSAYDIRFNNDGLLTAMYAPYSITTYGPCVVNVSTIVTLQNQGRAAP